MISRLPQGNLAAVEQYHAIHDPNASPEQIERAITWLEQSPEHRAAFEEVANFLASCERISQAFEDAELERELAPPRPRTLRRITGWILAASAVAASVFGGYFTLDRLVEWHQQANQLGSIARYATAIGETRLVHLPDSSTVRLGGASAVNVAFDGRARRVVLTDGEALFSVARDKDRPFIVEANSGSIQAHGTEFDVHRVPDGTIVTVVNGTVGVRTLRTNQVTLASLSSGMQVTYFTDGRMSDVGFVNPNLVTSWSSGFLRFVSAPLSMVVAELNRYSTRPIVIDSDQIADEPITGTVRTDGIVEWLEALGQGSAIDVDLSGDGPIVVRAKPISARHAPVKSDRLLQPIMPSV